MNFKEWMKQVKQVVSWIINYQKDTTVTPALMPKVHTALEPINVGSQGKGEIHIIKHRSLSIE